jgi:hypothetical protein
MEDVGESTVKRWWATVLYLLMALYQVAVLGLGASSVPWATALITVFFAFHAGLHFERARK